MRAGTRHRASSSPETTCNDTSNEAKESVHQVSWVIGFRCNFMFIFVIFWCLLEVVLGVLGGGFGSGFWRVWEGLRGSRASWAASWGHLGSKIAPKGLKMNFFENLAPTWAPSWSQVGAKLEPSWSQEASREAPGTIF